jgi:AcrR family transcriptional regulator
VILQAAADVLAEQGPAGFTVDAVAARSGCGKATIYRRWPSRAHLLLETTNLATIQVVDPDTGSVREDMVILGKTFATKMRDTPMGALTAATVAEAAVNPETRELYAGYVAERREIPRQALLRGIERGELRPDIDVDLVLDMLSGPVFQRVLMTQMPLTDALLEDAVDAVLRGVQA